MAVRLQIQQWGRKTGRRKSSAGLRRTGPESESYSPRWGIKTGDAKLEYRVKTRTTDLAARVPCLYYSMMLFNEWIIARALPSEESGVQNVMTVLAFECMAVYLREPKPPP